MIIWRNEAAPVDQPLGDNPPSGTVEITRTEERNGRTHIWYAPVPATPAGDMPPDPVGMITAMTGLHNEWYEAWQASGFSEERAFELTLGMVQAGFTQG